MPRRSTPTDEVVEDKGVKILIDPKAVLFLLGTEMDFKTEKLSAQFVFNNPNQTSACGCGELVQLTPAKDAAPSGVIRPWTPTISVNCSQASAPVDVRRLFGGAGLFADGVMFGLVSGGEILSESGCGNGAAPSKRKAAARSNTPPRPASARSIPTGGCPSGSMTIPRSWRVWAARSRAVAQRKPPPAKRRARSEETRGQETAPARSRLTARRALRPNGAGSPRIGSCRSGSVRRWRRAVAALLVAAVLAGARRGYGRRQDKIDGKIKTDCTDSDDDAPDFPWQRFTDHTTCIEFTNTFTFVYQKLLQSSGSPPLPSRPGIASTNSPVVRTLTYEPTFNTTTPTALGDFATTLGLTIKRSSDDTASSRRSSATPRCRSPA